MKIIIASDIHGSAFYCRKLLEAFENEKADKMLLLGDILYHGPRNDLPKDYAPKSVLEMLNSIKNKIICVRGNCDTEVDQMVLQFPILADYCILPINDKIIYATHGHCYNPENLPPICEGNVIINGHTHIPACEQREGFIYMNCGSVSIPKENTPHSYVVLQDGLFLWKDIENKEVFKTFSLI